MAQLHDTSRDERDLEPQLLAAWRYARDEWNDSHPNGPVVFLTATHRGRIDQEAAFRSGKSNARFGQSLHNYKPAYAFDVAFARSDGKPDWDFDLFEEFAELLEPFGLQWGGRWPGLRDGPHFQLPMTPADASAGRVPTLTKLQALMREQADEKPEPHGWKLVVMSEREVVTTLDIAEGKVVFKRTDPAAKRVYIDVRSDG